MKLLMHFSHHFFFIKGSCFQNVQGLSVFKVNFLFLRKNIQVLSLYSQRLHMHHIIILLGVTCLFSVRLQIRPFFIHIFFHTCKSDICYVKSSTGFMLLYITDELFCN